MVSNLQLITNNTDVHIITVLVPRHGYLPDVGIAPAIFPCCEEQDGEQLVEPLTLVRH